MRTNESLKGGSGIRIRPDRAHMDDYRKEAPPLLRDFLSYHQTIQGHSANTIHEYFLDLRNYLRFLKRTRGMVPADMPFDEIPIDDVGAALVGNITISDVYDWMNYLTVDRGLNNTSRARKLASIRSFYKYLTVKAKVLPTNPIADVDTPRLRKSMPRFLTLDESVELLDSVDGPNAARDYCILTLFLNCGLRISELVGLNVTDIRGDTIRILGKGNKERILYLNDACQKAIQDWMTERSIMTLLDDRPLFVTAQNRRRITRAAVHKLVKKHLSAAGLDSTQYSSHKLRHTAATLMLQNGVDVRTLQEVLGHDHLNTTQIYTHVDNADLRIAARSNPLANVTKAETPVRAPQDPLPADPEDSEEEA